MVAAFEQSLSNMTTRLQHLTATAEQKVRLLFEIFRAGTSNVLSGQDTDTDGRRYDSRCGKCAALEFELISVIRIEIESSGFSISKTNSRFARIGPSADEVFCSSRKTVDKCPSTDHEDFLADPTQSCIFEFSSKHNDLPTDGQRNGARGHPGPERIIRQRLLSSACLLL